MYSDIKTDSVSNLNNIWIRIAVDLNADGESKVSIVTSNASTSENLNGNNKEKLLNVENHNGNFGAIQAAIAK